MAGAVALLGESVPAATVVGGAIFAGVIIANTTPRRPVADPATAQRDGSGQRHGVGMAGSGYGATRPMVASAVRTRTVVQAAGGGLGRRG